MKKGRFYSRTSYMEVQDAFNSNSVVRNESGLTWQIANGILEAECVSADEFTKTEKVSMTELARIFSEDVGASVFTVEFEKKDCSLRTLIGYRKALRPYLKYSAVIDLEQTRDESKDYDTRERKVYHERIQSLIVNNVKYIRK